MSKLLEMFYEGRSNPQKKCVPNLHAVVAENPSLDAVIQDEGVDDHACYLHGFGASIQMESTRDIPKVWRWFREKPLQHEKNSYLTAINRIFSGDRATC